MTSNHELSDLARRLSGTLVLPGSPDYDTARRAWNLAIDQRPEAIASPLSIDDIREIVVTAARLGLGVSVQPSGHGAGADLTGTILVRTRAFDELSIDVPARIARVGAGVAWGPVLAALDGTGLVALAGSNPAVNVVGYTINGGHSMFSRAHGLAAHAVTAVEYVDARGMFLRADEESDPELLWALRGGGGWFGVLTAIEFRLIPEPAIFGGKLLFSGDRAPQAISAAFELAETDSRIGLDTGMMTFPDAPMIPEPLRGRTVASVDVVHLGDAATGEALVTPLRAVGEVIADTLAPFTIGMLPAVAQEPVDPMPAVGWSATTHAFGIDDAEEFAAAFTAGGPDGLGRAGVRVLGGAVAGADAAHAAVGAPVAGALIGAGVLLLDPARAQTADAALQPLRDFATSRAVHGSIPTFLDAAMTLADAFDAETIARLERVKGRVDPEGVFRGNHAFS